MTDTPQTTNLARHHSLERTNPKGPGLPFIGRCTLCGETGLRATAAMKYCENPIGLTDEQALLEAINGPTETAEISPEWVEPPVIWNGKTSLRWLNDDWGNKGRALYAGALYLGSVDFLKDKLHPDRPWRAWLMTDGNGDALGWFETERLAKDAVEDGATKGLLR